MPQSLSFLGPVQYKGVITTSSQESCDEPGIKLGSRPRSSGICGCCWLTLSVQTLPAGAGTLVWLQTCCFVFDNVTTTTAAPTCHVLWRALPRSPPQPGLTSFFLPVSFEVQGEGLPRTEASARLGTPELQRPT